jgi:hypothetical protein
MFLQINYFCPKPFTLAPTQLGWKTTGRATSILCQRKIFMMNGLNEATFFYYFNKKIGLGLMFGVGFPFVLDPTPCLSPNPWNQKVQPHRIPTHGWDS